MVGWWNMVEVRGAFGTRCSPEVLVPSSLNLSGLEAAKNSGFREVKVCSNSHSKKAAIWDTLNCFYLASETKIAILLKT